LSLVISRQRNVIDIPVQGRHLMTKFTHSVPIHRLTVWLNPKTRLRNELQDFFDHADEQVSAMAADRLAGADHISR
jgi:hypothetical protein